MHRRTFLGAGLTAAAGLVACRTTRWTPNNEFDAVVAAGDGGTHASLAAAIADAPADGQRPWRIRVGRGRWYGKLVIDKPNIHLIGDDRAACVITHDTAAGMRRPDGEPWGTWGCASVIVRAPDFAAHNLTIENAFDYVGNLGSPDFQPIGPNGLQAVALMLAGDADRSFFEHVDFIGHQDTLFADAGRSLFRDCHVSGSVDFIFGAGRALFEDCEITSRFRPGKPRQGYVAVPSTPAVQEQGLVFSRCRLTREAAVPDRSVALGRAWRPGKTFPDGKYGDPSALGNAVFLSCWMDAHIDSDPGWDPMGYTARGGEKVKLDPLDARLFEYDSRGPGAARSATRRWLDASQAAGYAPDKVLAGWAVPA